MTMFHLVGRLEWCTKYCIPMKMDVFWSLSTLKRKKDTVTMACTNMILIGTLKDNMNFDVLTRNRFLIHYFVLFWQHEGQEWILEFTIFRHFPFIRANDHKTAAKLLCRVQIGQWEDGSTITANFEAIFCPSGRRNVAISSFVQNLLLFICAVAAFHVNAHFSTTIPS